MAGRTVERVALNFIEVHMRNAELTPEEFLKDVKDHRLTIIRDDGVYRHIRLSRPGTSCYHFDLITWPGYLCYCGDMGTYVFSRVADMFNFFRKDSEKMFSIDRRYWAEKCQAKDGSGIKEFDEDLFNANVMTHLIEWIRSYRSETTKEQRRDLWDAVVGDVIHADGDSGGHRKQIAANDFHHQISEREYFHFTDFWEVDNTRYTHRFNWCCFALVWGIDQYDQSKQEKAAA
jgi:hypothetical protein